MENNNMRHLDFIETVAAGDVAHVRLKEQTYKGSWKRRGGVGAFMMLARKWDRLEGIVDGPSTIAYDIFAHIAASMDGADGGALAEVRDLRRYLMLVEAEMLSRQDQQVRGDLEAIAKRGVAATERRVPRLLRRVQDKNNRSLLVGDPCTMMTASMDTAQEVTVQQLGDHNFAVVEMKDGTLFTAEGAELRYDETRQRTPEDGGHHATAVPWLTGQAFFIRQDISVEDREKFWCLRAPGTHVLEAHVLSETIPRVLRAYYIQRGATYLLDMSRVPADVRDFFPNLGTEKNMKEWEELPDWQRPLYTWHEDGAKYVLADQYRPWHVEAE